MLKQYESARISGFFSYFYAQKKGPKIHLLDKYTTAPVLRQSLF